MEELVRLLMQALNDEWKAVLQYQIHASQLRGIFRDGISEHMKEHAEDEVRHAEELTAHMFGKGLDVNVIVPEISTSMNHLEMLAQDLRLEIEAVDLYAQIVELIGDDPQLADTKVLIESILTDEVGHQDEFAAMLRARIGDRGELIGGPGGPVTASVAQDFVRIADQSDALSDRFGTGGVAMLKRADAYTDAAKMMVG